ncbi:hypothetical protein [Streptomyces sp. NPDC048462]|uniref:hypothetical protein n=1 Tax=Streptomyces sp. NPDC048462 TaxID=3365555 RepID=UPI0037213757
MTDPLDEIEHPILEKTAEQFATDDAKHERIRAVDDQVLFKVKVQRWRGAVWVDADLPWQPAAARTAPPTTSTPLSKLMARVPEPATTPATQVRSSPPRTQPTYSPLARTTSVTAPNREYVSSGDSGLRF